MPFASEITIVFLFTPLEMSFLTGFKYGKTEFNTSRTAHDGAHKNKKSAKGTISAKGL